MNKDLGITLKKIRGKKTITEMGYALGVSASAVSSYECGKKRPSDKVKVEYAKQSGKTVQELFY